MATIVCFGDSNTWGCPPFLNVAQAPARLPRASRWPHAMGSILGADIEIVEEGLSGRTTVFDDPIEGVHKNGLRMLPGVVESHSPIDVLIIMLGVNDFKVQFGASAFTSARGILTLVQLVKGMYALADRAPEILIVTPPAIAEPAERAFWGDAVRRCEGHAYYLQQVADRTGCFHFDANQVVSAGADGVHLDEAGHLRLGVSLAEKVREILQLVH